MRSDGFALRQPNVQHGDGTGRGRIGGARDEPLHGRGAQQFRVAHYRGQGRREVLGKVGVIAEADCRDIVGHLASRLPQRSDRSDRRGVIGAEERAELHLPREQALAGIVRCA